MEVKDRRHKVEQREEFTDQQKAAIAAKSDDCCVWCGKKVYFGYGGTVDHFVPLKKGGTNEFVNLVLMCNDCNQKKGSMVVPPNIAGTHLKDDHRSKLGRYFDNYIESFDYISRGNLLACDMYEILVIPEVVHDAESRARKHGKSLGLPRKPSKFLLRRAYPEDEELLLDYYVKYLKKYNLLHSREAVLENIKFWMRFGVVYYIERSGDIQVLCTVLMNRHGYASINVFTYYSTRLAVTLAHGVVTCIGDTLLAENDLPYLPISVNMIKDDTSAQRILNLRKAFVVDDRLACVPYFIYNDDYPQGDSEEAEEAFQEGRKRLVAFLDRFYNIEDIVSIYFYENDLFDEYDWMSREILERDFFTQLGYDDPGVIRPD